MIRALLITILTILFSINSANAQVDLDIENMSLEQAQAELRKYLTDDVVNASKPLNNTIDFMANNYSEQDLKALIKNFELVARKSAEKQGMEYVPYDRKIDINNPAQVKRFLKNRINIIF